MAQQGTLRISRKTSGRGNSGKGNSGKGNSGKGNSGRGNSGRGNSGRKSSGKGKGLHLKKSTKARIITTILLLLLAGVVTLLFTGQKGHMGIDVSHHQGEIDWEKVAAAGDVEYAFIKATEGTSVTDKKYETNLQEAKKQGIPVGPYHFFSAKTGGKEQFEHFRKVAGYDFELRPVLDLEEGGGKITDDGKYRDEVTAWIEACREYYGCYPIVYAGYHFIKDHGLKSIIEHCPYWMAWYVNMPKSVASRRHFMLISHPGTQAILWQYSEKGSHEGVNGDLDMDECWEMPTIFR